jgi:hypothetical protein
LIAKTACDREHARAEDRLRAHVEHVSHHAQSSDKATTSTNSLITSGLSRTASTPVMDKEWIKLAKAANEAEAKRNDVMNK